MSGSGNQSEPGVVLLMFLFVLMIVGWLFWKVTGDFWLSYVLRWIRYGELWTINLFTHRYDACLNWLLVAPANNDLPSADVVRLTTVCFGPKFLSAVPDQELLSYYRLSGTSIAAIGTETIRVFRWVLGGILAALAARAILFSPSGKFMIRHTLETLIEAQAKIWPILMPIVRFNPSKSGRILGGPVPEEMPLFAEALSPEEWISFNRIPLTNGIPARDSVRRAFLRQLGPRWDGSLSALPGYMRALLAAFALMGVQRRGESDVFLGRIAAAWYPDKGFCPDDALLHDINKLLNDPNVGGKILLAMNKHAWRTTAMIGALKWARDNGGVLAPAQFLWLRAADRALWYPLNNLGRRAFHSEGAGAMAHYMAEALAEKPLPIPRLDTAIVTLNTYLHDPDKRSVPIPPRENEAPLA
ncbi:MAG: hypothetical protein PHS57_00560 [Alphaproteobacteria bacterium]|nr:hypothetical protein [Alphaproteobacteria bacterium]